MKRHILISVLLGLLISGYSSPGVAQEKNEDLMERPSPEDASGLKGMPSAQSVRPAIKKSSAQVPEKGIARQPASERDKSTPLDPSNIRAFNPQPEPPAQFDQIAPTRTLYRYIHPQFRDDDDLSSLPFLLDPDDLKPLGMQVGVQDIPKLDRRALAALKRELPILKVRIHAVITSNDDGRDSAEITPAEIQQLVDQTNRVWWRSGIEFLFNPERDVERVNDTLLNQDCSLRDYMRHLEDPEWDPRTCDGSANHEARQNKALEMKGRLATYFRYGTRFRWNEETDRWDRTPATGGFSGHTLEFVVLTRRLAEKNFMAHEIGHYMHLPHPFVKNDTVDPPAAVKTVDQAVERIVDWVENKGHPAKDGLLAFDGDNKGRFPDLHVDINDTPPDALGAIFATVHGEGAKCDKSHDFVQIPVTFSNGYQAMYTLKPDRLLVMSYFKGCHNLGTHYLSDDQIRIARNALINGNRSHLPRPTIDKDKVIGSKTDEPDAWDPGVDNQSAPVPCNTDEDCPGSLVCIVPPVVKIDSAERRRTSAAGDTDQSTAGADVESRMSATIQRKAAIKSKADSGSSQQLAVPKKADIVFKGVCKNPPPR